MMLGVLKDFCMQLVWVIIIGNGLGLPHKPTADERYEDAVDAIAAELTSFYARWRLEHPTLPLTEIQHFTKNMIGTPQGKLLRTKAAETKGFFYLFCVCSSIPANIAYLGAIYGHQLQQQCFRSW